MVDDNYRGRRDPQIEFELAVDPVNPFVIPIERLHIAQVQEAQAKTPLAVVVGQAKQPVGDRLILSVLPGFILVAGFADPKGFAGKPDGNSLVLNRIFVHLTSLKWPHHFFASASATMSALSWASTYSFFRRRFSSSSSFMRVCHGGVHPAVLGTPFVKRGGADAQVATQLRYR